MFPNILSTEQTDMLGLLKSFKREFILVGGTAIALQIGHRKSIDFDLFKDKPLNKKKIKDKIYLSKLISQKLFENDEGLHYLINQVKWTFFYYPYPIKGTISFESYIKMPDLLTLAAMKFYAMGRRAKWKDYVDIYFLLNDHFTIEEVSQKARALFEGGYSEKLFRQQLAYFEDIDYSEPIEWVQTPVSEDTIKESLTNISLNF
jgi:hypothetical protein